MPHKICIDPTDLLKRLKPLSDEARWAFLHFQLNAWIRSLRRGWPRYVDHVAADMRISPRRLPRIMQELITAGLIEWTAKGIIPIGLHEQREAVREKRRIWKLRAAERAAKKLLAEGTRGTPMPIVPRPSFDPYAQVWLEITGTEMPSGPVTDAVFRRFMARINQPITAERSMTAFRNYLLAMREQGKTPSLASFAANWDQWVPKLRGRGSHRSRVDQASTALPA